MKRILFFLFSGLVFFSCNKDEEEYPLSSDFEGKFVFISTADGSTSSEEVFTLDKHGLRRLTSTDNLQRVKSIPIWIKNGKQIQYDDHELSLGPTFGRNKIIRADGTDLRDFSTSFISPDNIYAYRAFLNLELYTVDDNLEIEQVETILNIDYIQPVEWAPDSKHIAFTLKDGGERKLVSYNMITKEITHLFSYDENIRITGFDWSYTNKVAFIWNDDVYVVNTDGTNLQNLASSPKNVYDLAWSPTGDLLAYSQGRSDGSVDLILHDITSSTDHVMNTVQQLYEYTRSLKWSADGESIAFVCNSGIYIIDRNGSNLKRVGSKFAFEFDWYTK